MAPEIS